MQKSKSIFFMFLFVFPSLIKDTPTLHQLCQTITLKHGKKKMNIYAFSDWEFSSFFLIFFHQSYSWWSKLISQFECLSSLCYGGQQSHYWIRKIPSLLWTLLGYHVWEMQEDDQDNQHSTPSCSSFT